jgi:hypothetical protein
MLSLQVSVDQRHAMTDEDLQDRASGLGKLFARIVGRPELAPETIAALGDRPVCVRVRAG